MYAMVSCVFVFVSRKNFFLFGEPVNILVGVYVAESVGTFASDNFNTIQVISVRFRGEGKVH
jgi:hypothetical protein